MGTLDINSEILIDTFIDDSWLEKGLSKNTLSAYRHDIISFSNWYKGSSLLDVSRIDLLDYLALILIFVFGVPHGAFDASIAFVAVKKF